MKKTKMIAVLSALVLGLVITSCSNTANGGSTLEESKYKVGDLVLTDGSVIAYDENRENFSDVDLETNKPVAVIFRKGNNGSALGVGLQQSTGLEWAKNETTGYYIKFTDIICTPKKDGSVSFDVWNSSKTWEGDTDGSDNWIKICTVDNLPSSNQTNYPAFNFALTYGTKANLTGIYADNWFLPSIAELVELYINKTKVNKVLNALGEKAKVIEEKWYWSSSQCYDNYYEAIALKLSDGDVDWYPKNDNSEYVCVVRAF